MDYKEQIEKAKHAAAKWREKHTIVGVGELRVDCMVDDLTRSITDLLSRAEAAEARCETLGKLVKEYQEELIPGYRERAEKAEMEIERLKCIMRDNGIMAIPSKYPGCESEWNLPRRGQKEE